MPLLHTLVHSPNVPGVRKHHHLTSSYLHGSCVFFESVCRGTPGVSDMGVPHIDNVVVPTASQESAIR